jgi:hypothetical protein
VVGGLLVAQQPVGEFDELLEAPVPPAGGQRPLAEDPLVVAPRARARPHTSRPWEMSSSVIISLAKVTGCRYSGVATRVPRPMREVTVAAAVRVGTQPNHGSSRSHRHMRWSWVQAWSKPNSSALRQCSRATGQRCSGRMTMP